MGKENVLESVRLFYDEGKYVEAYTVCLLYEQYLEDHEEDDFWAFDEVEEGSKEEEEIYIYKLKCRFKALAFAEVGKLRKNEPLDDGFTAEGLENTINDIKLALGKLAIFVLRAPLNGVDLNDKFDSLYGDIIRFAIDEYINSCERDYSLFDTLKYTYAGFDYVCFNVMFSTLTFIASNIPDVTFDAGKYRDLYFILETEKFIQMYQNTVEQIVCPSNDLVFTDENVRNLYFDAEYFIRCAKSGIKRLRDAKGVDEYLKILKEYINLHCDFLNAVYLNVDTGNSRSILKNEETRQEYYSYILECEKEIKLLEPDYVHPKVVLEVYNSSPSSSSGGCYVATAVYGSYDCPQVWTLRRYRDYTLATTWYGRAFIRTYYAISPTLVKWFGHTDWFKKMWQGKLDSMVAKLQAKGVESTPYEDKEW